MLYKNVLVPFDDSDHARSALHTAIDLVGDDAAACIHVVMVVSSDIMPPSMLAAPSVISDTFMDYQNYEAMLAAMTERSNKELHDNVHAILGQDANHLAARLVVEARLSPSPRRRHLRLRIGAPAATSSSWAVAAWARCAACWAA